jgi:hypothetical protein
MNRLIGFVILLSFFDIASAATATTTKLSPAQVQQKTLQQQVDKQVKQPAPTCNGYFQSGVCVNNGNVAYRGGSPVSSLNKPTSTWAGAGKTQTCSLVYKYVGGRVVGNAQTVCKIQ